MRLLLWSPSPSQPLVRSSGQHKQAGTDIYNWLTLSILSYSTSSNRKQKFVVIKLINNNSNFPQQKHRMKMLICSISETNLTNFTLNFDKVCPFHSPCYTVIMAKLTCIQSSERNENSFNSNNGQRQIYHSFENLFQVLHCTEK